MAGNVNGPLGLLEATSSIGVRLVDWWIWGAVGVRKGFHKGIPDPFVLGNIVTQSGNQGSVVSLCLVIYLWIVRGRGDIPDA